MSGKLKLLNIVYQTLNKKPILLTPSKLFGGASYSFSTLSWPTSSVFSNKVRKVKYQNAYGNATPYIVGFSTDGNKTPKTEKYGRNFPEPSKYGDAHPEACRSGDTPHGTTKGADTSSEKPPGLIKRFKAMYRDYWYVLVPVHVITSVGWFGTFYYLAKSGVDLASVAEQLNLSESIVAQFREKANSTTGYLAISYLLYKIATPLRYTVTLGGTTISINYLTKCGYIKPLPKRAELKKMLSDKRESFKEKRENVRQTIRNRLKKRKS